MDALAFKYILESIFIKNSKSCIIIFFFLIYLLSHVGKSWEKYNDEIFFYYFMSGLIRLKVGKEFFTDF